MTGEHKPGLLDIITGADLEDLPAFPHPRQRHVIDKRCLLQDTYWIDTYTHRHHLVEMTPTYRANVIDHLLSQAPLWLLQAWQWLHLERAIDLHDHHEAHRRALLLGSAPSTWIETAPLLRRLRHLNNQPQYINASAPDGPLRDSDHGTWQIATVTADYHLDMDHRRLQRHPRHTGPRLVRTGPREVTVRRTFDTDGTWLYLDELVQCQIGLPLLAFQHQPGRGTVPLSSTIVQRIRPAAAPSQDQ